MDRQIWSSPREDAEGAARGHRPLLPPAGLDADRLLADDLMAGPLLEAFVAGELLKQAGWSHVSAMLHHYRTCTQQEVDFVLEDPAGRLVGIEVKKTASPAAHDFRGLRHLVEQTGKHFVRSIPLYTGTSSGAFGPTLWPHRSAACGGWRGMVENHPLGGFSTRP